MSQNFQVKNRETKGRTASSIAIAEAVLTLMADRPLNEISVIDVVAKAGVSRSTFYLYYKDCYNVIEQIVDVFCDEIIDLINQTKDKGVKNVIFAITSYVKERKDVFKLLLTKEGEALNYRIRRKLEGYLSSIYGFPYIDKTVGKYFSTFVFDGSIGVFSQWILDDCQKDPEEVVSFFISILSYAISTT